MVTIITGDTGMLGEELRRLVSSGVGMSRNSSDMPIDISGKVDWKDVETGCVDKIIHTAGMTDVNKCESYPQQSYNVNVLGTKNIVRLAETTQSHLTFVSTSFVFSGDKDVYLPDSRRRPVNVYGEHKKQAEDLVSNSDTKSHIVRTSDLYGESKGILKWLPDIMEKQESVKLISDKWLTPTLVTELAECILEISETKATGVSHICSDESVTRVDVADAVKKTYDLDTKIDNVLSSEVDVFNAERPDCVKMKSEKFTDCTDIIEYIHN